MVIRAERQTPAGCPATPSELQARAACGDVIAQFFQYVDSGQATKATQLFTTDGEMSSGEITLRGEQIRQVLSIRETDGIRRLHFPTQIGFELVSPTEAKAQTLLQLFLLDTGAGPGAAPHIQAITHVDDVLVLIDAGWRISRRRVTVLAGTEAQ
jgi:hypothetical protein